MKHTFKHGYYEQIQLYQYLRDSTIHIESYYISGSIFDKNEEWVYDFYMEVV